MTAAPLKIGLVGCGHIGRVVHLQTLQRLPTVQVTSLADSDPGCLEAARAQCPEARAFTDFRDLLEQGEVDAIVICLPNAFHAEAAIAAFDRNKHVYLEKPLALTLTEGSRVLDAWRKSGCIGMIGFNYRFNPLHVEMQRQLRSGRAGQVVGARSVWTTAAPRMPKWKTLRQTGGGVLLDFGSHHFDLFRFWFDQPIVEVSATVRSHRVEYDTAIVRLRLGSDLLVDSFFSLSSIEDERFEVYGTTGKLSFDRFNSWNIELTDLSKRSIPVRYARRAMFALPHSSFALKKLAAPGSEPSYSTALIRFLSAVQTGQQLQPDLNDGFQSLAVVIAAEESARLGVPVSPAATAG